MEDLNELDKIALRFSDEILVRIQDLTHDCIDAKYQASHILNTVGNVLMSHILNIYSLTNGLEITRDHFVEEMTELSKHVLSVFEKALSSNKARDI